LTDGDGLTFVPIMRRRYDCPVCDFHHLEAYSGPGDTVVYRPAFWPEDEEARERRRRNAITADEYRRRRASPGRGQGR
jgi:hypothetical protein